MRYRYYNNPKQTTLYTLKYKKIIDDANKGSKDNAIAIVKQLQRRGLIFRNLGIFLAVGGFLSFALMGYYMVSSMMFSILPMILISIVFLSGGYIINYGITLIKFTDYIDTNRSINIFNDECFCSSCGHENDNDASYCKKCGNRL